MGGEVLVPISVGELFDKMSILEIKRERLTDPAKLANVRTELELLEGIAATCGVSLDGELRELLPKLKAVNTDIWDAEDRIRDCERRGVFEAEFLDVARSIYHLNDGRAAVKRQINVLTSSTIVEEKSYASYSREDQG